MIRLDELNVALVLRHRPLALDVGPAVDPGGPQQQTDAPGGGYHEGRLVGRSLGAIRQRSRHTEVPIEADDQQIQHGRIRGQIVEGQPGVADMWPQRPVAEYGGDCEQWHRDGPDGKVRDGQREEEVVADRLQLLVNLERDHHHHVARNCQRAQNRRYETHNHHRGERVARPLRLEPQPRGIGLIAIRIVQSAGRCRREVLQQCRQQGATCGGADGG